MQRGAAVGDRCGGPRRWWMLRPRDEINITSDSSMIGREIDDRAANEASDEREKGTSQSVFSRLGSQLSVMN